MPKTKNEFYTSIESFEPTGIQMAKKLTRNKNNYEIVVTKFLYVGGTEKIAVFSKSIFYLFCISNPRLWTGSLMKTDRKRPALSKFRMNTRTNRRSPKPQRSLASWWMWNRRQLCDFSLNPLYNTCSRPYLLSHKPNNYDHHDVRKVCFYIG